MAYVLFSVEKKIEKDEGDSSKGLWTKFKDLFINSKEKITNYLVQPEEHQSMWNRMFLTSYVIAVIIDPLFFYVPIINEDRKCLGMDQKLKIVALVLRSVTDLFYILHVVFRIRIQILAKSDDDVFSRKNKKSDEEASSRNVKSDEDDSKKRTKSAEDDSRTFKTHSKSTIESPLLEKYITIFSSLKKPIIIAILAILPLPQVRTTSLEYFSVLSFFSFFL